jgi:solute carrier family 25 (mitochondrial oxoglutarate transporter), member 11
MQNFLIGGASGMFATIIIQPIDFIKVQIQVRSEMGQKNLNPFSIAQEIRKETGTYKTFYKGLDSALLRQAVYTSTRLGLFYSLKDMIIKKTGKEPSMFSNVLMSLFAGAVGSFVGNPADLALVRMQSDNNLPEAERRNYKNVFDALSRTVKEEGIFTLWRGSLPTVVRAMAMNFSLLVPFEETKKLLVPYIENARMRAIVASCIAGAAATVLSLPFDNVKTKLQKMKKLPDGTYPYKGVTDCIMKTAQKEGAAKLWVGVNTYYIRVAPHAVISLVTNEFLRNFFSKKNKK